MIEVYIDAASQGNPGLSGGGIFVKGEGKNLEYSIPLGIMNNHLAEFATLVKALEICKDNGFSVVSFRSDSQIVCDSIEKGFVKNQEFKAYLDSAQDIIRSLDLFFIKWIPSKENKHADILARQAIHNN
ncbi:reverse transcriptase-like protein [Caldibacillus lycopersici]|uniref:Reverse transcriptase-like protein n=1 Tax=Perspicuibacillus lycopersici TaxID=1325689 RepID=A0AAE3ISG6_9BACI|nr:reverse transcriptase-like protein [Perspicuibacillus lycopersici]MCU9613651.1 reverse transcriptase-like protein [Perspicuibacillus lycopersici]